MDIVLGVSMTPTTVRMVLVEGENADGITVDHDVFDVASADDSANAAEQVVSAVYSPLFNCATPSCSHRGTGRDPKARPSKM